MASGERRRLPNRAGGLAKGFAGHFPHNMSAEALTGLRLDLDRLSALHNHEP